jgi:DNA primase
LNPGFSLRFAFLPPGEDPDSFLRANGAAAMKEVLDAAEPLARVLWRVETEGKDFSTPERRAGLERSLAEIVSAIREPKIADYYRRDFEQRVFDAFKRRAPATRPERSSRDFTPRRGQAPAQPRFQTETVSAAVKNSLIVRAGGTGARRAKEIEIAALLIELPDLALRHSEILASLPLADRALDRLRHELLNLAASRSRLEKEGVESHLIRAGLGELLERLRSRLAARDLGGEAVSAGTAQGGGDDIEARWLEAVAQLREMAELAPERKEAMERFKSEATEQSWLEAQRLLGGRVSGG